MVANRETAAIRSMGKEVVGLNDMVANRETAAIRSESRDRLSDSDVVSGVFNAFAAREPDDAVPAGVGGEQNDNGGNG